jgi:hypothetical protein
MACLRSWMRALRKLLARSWSERAALLEAFVWLGVMRVGVAGWPFRRIAARLGLTQTETVEADQVSGVGPARDASAAEVSAAAHVGWAVQVASARTPWQSTCLVQALAGMAMLRRRRLRGTLFLGVSRNATATGHLAAHAWLRCCDVVLIGDNGREGCAVVGVFVGSSRPGGR